MSESLKSKTISNISYSALGKMVAFAFQAVTNVIMSRELGAGDYGIVGFALIIVNFLKGFGDLGINAAAIQSKSLDRRGLDTAFTLRFSLGIVIYLLAFVIAQFTPLFFANQQVVWVVRLLALNIILYTLGFIPGVLLSRCLRFKYLVISDTILSIVSSLVAIAMALNGFKFWSIVAASLASNLAYVIALNLFAPQRIGFGLDRELAADYLKYGTKVFLSGLLAFALLNVDNFTIGAVAGEEQLGFYIIAFNWGSMVCSVMSGTVYNVLFPTLSTIQGDTEKSVRAYLRIVEYVALAAMLFNTVLFCVSHDFLVYVLGKGTAKWLPSLAALQILCVYGVARCLLEALGTFFTAKGLPGVVLKANLLVAGLELLLVYPAVRYGSIELVALLVLLAYLTASAVYLANLPLLGLAPRDLWQPLRPALLALLAALALYQGVLQRLSGGIVLLVLQAAAVTAVYLLVYSLLTRFKMARWSLEQFQALQARKG